MEKIENFAKRWKIENISMRDDYVAKVAPFVSNQKQGKLVLVTAMTSNKSGIGKTTISIGLADALNKLGHRTFLALREPSMGPVFGIKGGATGGGKSQIFPADQINLHFTGDFHAIAQANNLLVSVLDNHIFQGNEFCVDTKKIYVKRCLDLNERSLRRISYFIGEEKVETGFVITAASEIMAIMALSRDFEELKQNLGGILVAMTKSGKPLFARDFGVVDSLAILLKDAFCPNLVQTLEGSPALVHLGPFANIAHGCNSVVATNYALANSEICVTEAGFGSDLGAEKFFDIKCRILGRTPDAVVLVVTLKVVKEQGRGDILKGFENVKKHIENCRNVFGLETIVALNRHGDDDAQELGLLENLCKREGVVTKIANGFEEGSLGCTDLAKSVFAVLASERKSKAKFVYSLDDTICEKIEKIATKVYGAGKVEYSDAAKEKISLANKLGFSNFFVNIAKTQFSFSADKNLLGAPKGFVFHITDIEIRSGAKMIVAIAGDILLMPGLAKKSNYLGMKMDADGNISGIV